MNHSSKSKFQSGFTILEVLIASVLVGVGIFALMEAFNRGFSGAAETENYSLALSLTQEKLEELKDSTFASLASSAKAALASPYNKFQQQATVTSVHADLKQVVVTTYWNVPGSETSVNLTTHMVNTS